MSDDKQFGFDALIAAFTIFKKYSDTKWPTHCEHDVMYICGVDPSDVTDEDKETLRELGFEEDLDDECFYSFRFGSA